MSLRKSLIEHNPSQWKGEPGVMFPGWRKNRHQKPNQISSTEEPTKTVQEESVPLSTSSVKISSLASNVDEGTAKLNKVIYFSPFKFNTLIKGSSSLVS